MHLKFAYCMLAIWIALPTWKLSIDCIDSVFDLFICHYFSCRCWIMYDLETHYLKLRCIQRLGQRKTNKKKQIKKKLQTTDFCIAAPHIHVHTSSFLWTHTLLLNVYNSWRYCQYSKLSVIRLVYFIHYCVIKSNQNCIITCNFVYNNS